MVVSKVVLLIRDEAVRRDNGDMVRALYSVLMEVGLEVGRLMDVMRKEEREWREKQKS